MKKTYIIPTLLSLEMKSRKPLMTVSTPNAGYNQETGVAPEDVEGRYSDTFDEEDEW